MVGEALLAGSCGALPAGLGDGFSLSVGLVVAGGVADGLMQADGVVEPRDPVEFVVEHDGSVIC